MYPRIFFRLFQQTTCCQYYKICTEFVPSGQMVVAYPPPAFISASNQSVLFHEVTAANLIKIVAISLTKMKDMHRNSHDVNRKRLYIETEWESTIGLSKWMWFSEDVQFFQEEGMVWTGLTHTIEYLLVLEKKSELECSKEQIIFSNLKQVRLVVRDFTVIKAFDGVLRCIGSHLETRILNKFLLVICWLCLRI